MMKVADIAPPNSLLLIMDRSAGEVPETLAGHLVAATGTCIAIGTLSEHDGTTRVTLDGDANPAPHDTPVFDGLLETPGLELAVCTVLDDVVLAATVPTQRTWVRVWANDQTEPSEIRILHSAAGQEP